jgi:hypothetical protein
MDVNCLGKACEPHQQNTGQGQQPEQFALAWMSSSQRDAPKHSLNTTYTRKASNFWWSDAPSGCRVVPGGDAQSPKSSLRRLVWARLTGTSVCFLSSMRNW